MGPLLKTGKYNNNNSNNNDKNNNNNNNDIILNVVYTNSREGEKRLNEHIGELKKQLSARDTMIQRLQKDLKQKEQVSGVC